MSTFISLRTTRRGCAVRKDPIQAIRTRSRFGKSKIRLGRRYRLLIGRPKTRKGHKGRFFGRSKPLFNMAMKMAARAEMERQARIPQACRDGDHTWNTDCNPDYCTACGTSIWHHAFMECP
jgi:hypothetical protein